MEPLQNFRTFQSASKTRLAERAGNKRELKTSAKFKEVLYARLKLIEIQQLIRKPNNQ